MYTYSTHQNTRSRTNLSGKGLLHKFSVSLDSGHCSDPRPSGILHGSLWSASLKASPSNANWRAAGLNLISGWRRAFTPAEIAGLDASLGHARQGNPQLELARLRAADFPLSVFAAEIEPLRARLVDVGFSIFEGFPVERYTVNELRAIYWGLSLHLGTPVAQSKRGDVLGDVRDIGTGISGKQGRGYTSNQELNFHCDAADVSGLFFLRCAKSGGLSRIASSLAVHDEIARRSPDLLELLYQPFYWSWQGNQPVGAAEYYEMPVFGRAGDDIACAYVRTNILLAHNNAGAPAMTAAQIEAVELVAAVAREPGMYIEAMFEPGTMIFMNNHTVLHMRTAFEDWHELERKRHLLRVWLSMPNSRRLPDSFAGFFNDVGAGAVRGGYPARTDTPVFKTM